MTFLAVRTSSPEVGSSQIRMRGLVTRARMSTVFCFIPVEKVSVRSSANALMSSRSKM